MTVVKLNDYQVNLLKDLGNKIHLQGDGIYYYLPCWFKKLEDDKYEIISPDKLPDNLVEFLQNKRK